MIIPLLLMVAVGCRTHKESDIRVAEVAQTQTSAVTQTRTDSRAETQTEQAESADSIAWTATADSVVQTKVDGTREVMHRVRWTRTAYKPTATARASAAVQHTDTTSVTVAQQTHRQTAVQSHSESSRGGRPWWLLAVVAIATIVAVILVRRKVLK